MLAENKINLEKLSLEEILSLHEKVRTELTESLDNPKKHQEEINSLFKKLDNLNSYIHGHLELLPHIKEKYGHLNFPNESPQRQIEFFTQQTTEWLYQRCVEAKTNQLTVVIGASRKPSEPPGIMYG